MRRPPEDEPEDSHRKHPADGTEDFLNALATRHAGKLKFIGIAILLMCLAAIVLAVTGG